ncbi:MAG: amino acid adenylation domain-containing protein [Gammaproteobacteria bacterium]|nr:amino acid adenylation domain-containing protein [Gammaproteobacteria bacterium]MCP4275334.1 amino acid adenylation domain-containing protein [Gammaproteobacteria bacterium]MCP4831225.1 amino acid adenylation domain-containing protein [Gammaproteobacteria bacterium]
MTDNPNNPTPVQDNDSYAFEATASFAQQRLWFLDQLEPGSTAYNINFAIRLKGTLNQTILQESLDILSERHESLRTTFAIVNDVPVQVIAEQASTTFDIHILEDSTESALQELLEKLSGQAFNLKKGPLLRAHIIKCGDQEHVLLLVIHHSIADAWSLQILYGELTKVYAAKIAGTIPELPELPIQYADYAEWQQEWLSGEQLQQQLDYWSDLLRNSPARLELPTDRPRPRIQSSAGATCTHDIDAALTQGLKALARTNSTTLFNTCLAVFDILLSRYAGTDEVIIGTPVAGRKRPELQNLIGFFLNTIVMRGELSGNPSFTELLTRVKQDSIRALANDELPFEKLVEEIQPGRDTSYTPIFQTMFVLHHGGSSEASFANLTAENITINSGTAKFDLTLFVTEADNKLSLLFEYNTDLFDATTIERMLGHYESLLQAVVANPDAKLSQLSMLNAAEHRVVTEDFNASTADFGEPVCVHRLVEAQAEKTPDAVAVQLNNESLTYTELNNRANLLAVRLQELEAGSGSIVAISLERSLELPIAALAVLKAGACYVPVDPNYPAERIATMFIDSAAIVLLTQSSITLPPHNGERLDLDCFDFSAKADNLSGGSPSDPLYCIYTSGSTGKPKGVELSHAGLSNLLHWQLQHERLAAPAKTLQFASFSFDVHFQEFFGTWSNGGTTIMVDEELRQDLPKLASFIAEQNIERLFLPYAALQPIAETLVANNTQSALKDIVVAGEQLQVSPEVRSLFGTLTNAALHNQYGPSETHVVTALTLSGNENDWPVLPSIGYPVANTHCYVLDAIGEPCPVGIPGELYLGGVQVALGYLNQPALNAEKFTASPFIDSERLYRTGDRVRFLSDGQLEFLGRTDDQVKWRGFRIEPGEIETQLTEQPSVQQAIVLLREDKPGNKQLVAYVTGLVNDNAPDPAALKQTLKGTLPDYMVPSVIIILDKLPLTPSGKVARRHLPMPEYSRDESTLYVAPRNDTEESLLTIWADVLGLGTDKQQVGIHDNFFELGGHSLLATQLVARVRKQLKTEVPLIELFSNPTVAGLSLYLDNKSDSTGLPAITKRKAASTTHLSFAQQRLWFLDQLEPGNPVYNLPVVLQLSGNLNTQALQAALNDLVERHESLRTCFTTIENEPAQSILAKATVQLEQRDCKALDASALHILIDEQVQLGFDLDQAPLVHAVLLERKSAEHLLILTTHHIISDGWSLGIMLTELGKLYCAHCESRTHTLAALPIQYADYAVWQRDWLSGDELQRQLDYWRTELQDAPTAIDLPTDRPRPAEQSFNGAGLLRMLPKELGDQLQALASVENCTLFMLTLAAFELLLSRYAGTNEVVVGTPIAGRRLTELEELIGFFSNTLALHGDLSGDPKFSNLLKQTRATTLQAYAHQDLPFEKLVEELQPERDMSHSPIFQVMLVLQNNPGDNASFGDISLSFPDFEMGIAKFDLLMEIAETPEGLRTGLQYNTDLFDATTIERMLRHYETLLRAVVANPEAKLSELQLLDAPERKIVVDNFNASAAEFGTPICVHQLVETQVHKTPEAIAVLFGNESLTYTELNNRANILAVRLRELGAESGSIVAISLERSLELPVAALAVLKAGACYVPVDPNYPEERIATMLGDSSPAVILTQNNITLPAHNGQRLNIDTVDFNGKADNLNGGSPTDPLYCIYTSGSTGKPKGVQLSHAGLSNLLHWQLQHDHLAEPAKTLQFASFSFDVHFQEFFGTWSNGGTTVMVDEELRQDLPRLAGFIAEQNIERLFLPYAALQPIAETLVANNTTSALKDIVVAGEQLQVSPEVRTLFSKLSNAALHNQYGPSETHVVTALTLTGDENNWPALPSIGYPVANTRCYVLDAAGEPCPIGIPGELYLGGVQVALGYLNQPELNTEKFSASPFTDGDRLYKTGDRVRFLSDGQIEFLGRADDQLKWRGFRIEPGEIEAQLTAQPSVQQAVVVLREDTPGNKRLVAYITGDNTDSAALKQALKDSVPDYMVPSVIMTLDELPLTPSGKVARRRLPVPEYSRDESTPYVAPRNETEEKLTRLWADILGVDTDKQPLGIHDDFFELGGHSLLATQLVSRIRDQFGISLPLKYIFRHPTPAELVGTISALLATNTSNNDSGNEEDFEEFSL